MKSLEQELESTNEVNNSLTIVAATIYNHEHNYESALRVLKNDDTIEGYKYINRKFYIYTHLYAYLLQFCIKYNNIFKNESKRISRNRI